MNILSLIPKTIKTATMVTLMSAFAVPALASDSAPQFGVQTNATRSIASSATEFRKGDFSKSITYSRHALKQGLKKSRKATAYSNLCAALGADGQFEDAKQACDKALKIAPQNAQAQVNRRAVTAHMTALAKNEAPATN